MSDDPHNIKRGDTVRAVSGQHKGKTSTALRIMQRSSFSGEYAQALVKFTDGTADYCKMSELKKVDQPAAA